PATRRRLDARPRATRPSHRPGMSSAWMRWALPSWEHEGGATMHGDDRRGLRLGCAALMVMVGCAQGSTSPNEAAGGGGSGAWRSTLETTGATGTGGGSDTGAVTVTTGETTGAGDPASTSSSGDTVTSVGAGGAATSSGAGGAATSSSSVGV